jgi:mannose-1-phosphate guanylyltransferase/mannose-1-phosphate guanylyltransferase/mannose-6-phosphate isomerase
MSADSRITPVILSGGSGARLWPLSRLGRPKPLVAPMGGATLIQQTAVRVGDSARFAAPIVVTGDEYAEAIVEQMRAAEVPAGLVIVEPAPRGTAPAIALAALAAAEDDLLLVLPSDHVVADQDAFLEAVETGRAAAMAGRLVAFGIEPDRAETGYGYIRAGAALGDGAFAIERFAEKPDRETAEAWLAAGGWLWNAGLFLMRAGDCLAALQAHAPSLLGSARAAMAGATRDGLRLRPEGSAFAASPAASFDKAVMERNAGTAVVPARMGWSDVGSWEALHALGPLDADGNLLTGDVVAPDSRDCLVRSDGPVVVALGVSDLVIVATERAVLIVPRGQSQRVQEAIEALEARRGAADREDDR